jgi:hypothetical protein
MANLHQPHQQLSDTFLAINIAFRSACDRLHHHQHRHVIRRRHHLQFRHTRHYRTIAQSNYHLSKIQTPANCDLASQCNQSALMGCLANPQPSLLGWQKFQE